MEKLNITLAVLTWKAPKSLRSCLESVEPILHLFDDKLLVCQEGDPREIQIGEEFGFRTVKLEHNVGIQEGISKCFTSAKTEIVLFLENDLQLRVSPEDATRYLSFAVKNLNAAECDFVKLRFLPERRSSTSKAFHRYWRINSSEITRRFMGALRPKKANWELSTSTRIMYEKSLLAEGFQRINQDFLKSTTKYNKWENLGLLTTKKLIHRLVTFANQHPTSRSVNGKPDLEHPLNCSNNRDWLMNQELKLLICTPGMFGHRRYDRAEEDEKWQMVDPLDEGGEVEVS